MRHTPVLAIAFAFIATAAVAAPPLSSAAPTANTPTAQLHALFDHAWAEDHAKPPAGTTDYKLLWGDPSIAHEQAQLAQAKANLAALEKIDRAKLDPTDALSWRLFQYQLEDSIEAASFPDDAQGLITQLWGPQLTGNDFKNQHFDNAKGYATLVRKLDALGPYLDAFTVRLQQAMAAGITQPREVMERVPDEIKANIAADPTQSPFYAPFKSLPASIPAAQQAKLQGEARDAITRVVNPAYEKFLKFFQDDYLPHARTTAGVSSLPGGKAYYAYLVRHYTTTDMTPDQVHALGL